MRIFRDLSSDIIRETIATTGIFDGVHLAHQQIVHRLNELAKQYHSESMLVTFWPHPRYVLNKDAENLKLLSTLEEKIALLDSFGLQNMLIIPFDKYFASTPFDQFIRKVLVGRLQVKHLVVGYNHQFGKNREGNFDRLKEFGGKYKFEIEQLPKVEVHGERVSSSKIRTHLQAGKLELVNSMLGHNVQLTGNVTHGSKIGRQLGFPTANIEVTELYKLIPSDGVYAVEAVLDDKKLQGMLNIGTRPTVDKRGERVIEVNFFNFYGEIYGKHITILFLKRIREEQKFNSTVELVQQIKKDKEQIETFFKTKSE